MKTPEQNEPPATPAEELPGPMRPRRPEGFDAIYSGTPPWDIGRPQPAPFGAGGSGRHSRPDSELLVAARKLGQRDSTLRNSGSDRAAEGFQYVGTAAEYISTK